MRLVPREPQNSVDVIISIGLPRLILFPLLFARTKWYRDMLSAFIWSSKYPVWVESFDSVKGPDFDFRIESTNGDVVSREIGVSGRATGFVV